MDYIENRYWFDQVYEHITLVQTMLSEASQRGMQIGMEVINNKNCLYCIVNRGDKLEKLMDASINASAKAEELRRGKHDPLYYG